MPEKIQDELQIGIQAVRTHDDARPYGFRVLWIPWNSGFRGSELQVEDLITSLGGKTFEPGNRAFDFGGYPEQQFWATAGARDGDPISVTVVRGHETRTIQGKVRADRIYTTADGKRAIASPGPEAMATGGFDSPWQFWDEAIVKEMQAALEVGWRRNTRQQLASLLQHAPRIEILSRQYPGLYANAMKEDFERTVEWLRGRRYNLGPDDLVYRSLSEARVQDAIDRATRSWATYLAHTRAVELSSLPPVDPVRGDRSAITGRMVLLPEMHEISEAGHGWFWAKGSGASVFLVDQRSRAFRIILQAMLRFQELITPAINGRFTLVGEIGDSPAMVASGRQVFTGLTIEPVAALVDGRMFIETSVGDAAKFEGEEDATKPPVVDTRSDLSPAEVFRSFINALKVGEAELWASFLATWSCSDADGQGVYQPDDGPANKDHYREYTRARQQITGPVYDARVVNTSDVKVILDRQDLRVEEVRLTVDHVGLFDGE